MAIQDLRETVNEVFNEHTFLKDKVRELRILAGLETTESGVSGQEINTHTDKTTVVPTPLEPA